MPWIVEDTDAWWAQSQRASNGTMQPGSDRHAHSECQAPSQSTRPGSGRITLLEKQMKAIADQVGAHAESDQRSGIPLEIGAVTPLKPTAPQKPQSSPPKGGANFVRRFSNPAQQQGAAATMLEQRATLTACETHTPSDIVAVQLSAATAVQCKTIETTKLENPGTLVHVHDVKALDFQPEVIAEADAVMNAHCAMEPIAVAKALEVVVAHQIEGLGECLNICAQRSRTLKLLGFHHLHFDARLQSFLEQKSLKLGQLLFDMLLLARALFGFREVSRQGFLWRRIHSCQERAHREAVRFRQLSKKHTAACQRGYHYMSRCVSHSMQALLEVCFLGWIHSAALGKLEKLVRNEASQAEQAIASVQHRVVSNIVRNDDHSLVKDIWDSFCNFVHVCKTDKAEKAAHSQKLMRAITNAARMALAHSFFEWIAIAKRLKERRRRKDARLTMVNNSVVARELRWLLAQLNGWHLVTAQFKRKRKNMDRALRQVKASDDGLIYHCFTSWRERHLHQRLARRAQQKMIRSVSLTVASNEQCLMVEVFGVWRDDFVRDRHRCALTQAWKRAGLYRALQQIAYLEEALMACCFSEWRRAQLLGALEVVTAQSNCRESSRKIGVTMLEQQLNQRDQEFLQTCSDAWLQVAKSQRLHRNQSANACQHMNRQANDAGSSLQCRVFNEWVRAVCGEKQKRLREDLHDARSRIVQGEAERREQQMKTFAQHFAGTVEAISRSCFTAWLQQCTMRMMKSKKMTVAKQHCETLDTLLKMQFFFYWIHARHQEENARLTTKAESNALKNRERIVRVLGDKIRLEDGKWLEACASAWYIYIKHSKSLKDKQIRTMVIISGNREKILSNCFDEWHREVRHNQYAKLQGEFELEQKLRAEEEQAAKQKAADNILRSFANMETALTSNCFQEWNGLRLQTKGRAKKAAHIESTIFRAEQQMVAMCMQAWIHLGSMNKLEQKNQYAYKNNLSRVERQWALRKQTLTEMSFSIWSAAVRAEREKNRRKSQNKALVERMIGGIEFALMNNIFAEWQFAVALEKSNLLSNMNAQEMLKAHDINVHAAVGKTGDMQDAMQKMMAFTEWRHVTCMQAQVDASIKITREKAMVVMAFIGEGAVSILGHLCLGKWYLAAHNQKLHTSMKETNIANIKLEVEKPIWALLSRMLAQWFHFTINTKQELLLEKEKQEAQKKAEELRVAAEAAAVQRKQQQLATVSRIFNSKGKLKTKMFLDLWRRLLLSRLGKEIKLSVISRAAAVLIDALLLTVFLVWRLEVSSMQELKGCSKALRAVKINRKEWVAAKQEQALAIEGELLQRLLLAAWKVLPLEAGYRKALFCEAAGSRSTTAKARYDMLLYAESQNGGAMLGELSPLLLLVAWQGVAETQRLQKKLQDSSKISHSTTIARARWSAHRMGRLAAFRAKGRLFAFWRLLVCMELQYREDTKMHARCEAHGRALVIKLGDRLCKLRFFYRFLWLCQPKPREVEFPPPSRRAPDFSKDPPSFFVRPVSADRARWPITYVPSEKDIARYQAAQHAAVTGVTVLRPGPETRPAEQSGIANQRSIGWTSTQAGSQSAPEGQTAGDAGIAAQDLPAAERFNLAAKASTSDMEYRRLFEHNRREIREGRLERESPGLNVKGWGVWMA